MYVTYQHQKINQIITITEGGDQGESLITPGTMLMDISFIFTFWAQIPSRSTFILSELIK